MVPLEADVGDIIILDKRLIHCSLPNVSKNIRISMDIRFHKAGQSSGREPLPSFYVRSAKKEKNQSKNLPAVGRSLEQSLHEIIKKGLYI